MVLFTAEGMQSRKSRRIAKVRSKYHNHYTSSSYTSDSIKESLCGEYVRNFDHKFRQMFPDRRELFLMPKNEWEVPKFLCTTLRPTLLPFREVYNMKTLAIYLANYLKYEPLEDPNEFPEVLPSPTQVLDWKVADSFDFATLLASFMLGAGYDAYVAYGYAPSWICLRDQSQTSFPAAFEKECKFATQSEEEPDVRSTYQVKASGVPESAYLLNQGILELSQAATEKRGDTIYENEETDILNEDIQGHLHAWVIVRSLKRDVSGISLIEPTTGRLFSVTSAPYLGIEALWNSKNYWVNMQGSDVMMNKLDFDLANSDLWEYVFIDSGIQAGVINRAEDDIMQHETLEGLHAGQQGTETNEEEDGNLLDMPPSWVSKLVIQRSDFALRYPPDGQRSILYLRAKLELFAENHHDQGMVFRILLYKDKARTILNECREKFLNRRDKLHCRMRYPLDGWLVEDFLPGRSFSLRKLIEFSGRRRELYFYVSARQDGLLCRQEDIGQKIIERFDGRPDGLTYRSVSVKHDRTDGFSKPQYTLPGGESTGELIVNKMTQKFTRHPTQPADRDVAKRTFYVQEGQIRTQFHYNDLRITRPSRVHVKERHTSAVSTQHNNNGPFAGLGVRDATFNGLSNSSSSRGSMEDNNESMQQILAAERDCLTEVRRSQLEMLEMLKIRRREENMVTVDRPIFETAHERAVEDKIIETAVESKDAIDRLQVDYLTPFLQNVIDCSNIPYEEAQRARDACLKSLKERLIERANIIMTRLNEENAKLAKKQATFQRNQRDNDPQAEEDFERFCSEAMFRIQILEQRLSTHEETALRKFQDMDEKLCGDPRLRILQAS